MAFLPMAATFFAILILLSRTSASPDTTVTQSSCNLNSYSDNDPFAYSYAYTIKDLQNVTPNHENFNFDYYTKSPFQNNADAFGHGKCNAGLSSADCVACIISARAALEGQCLHSYGGRVVMVDCLLRYETYQFSD